MEWFKTYTSWGNAVAMMTDEEAGRFIKALFRFVETQKEQTTEGPERYVVAMATAKLKDDIDRTRDISESRRNAVAAREQKKHLISSDSTEHQVISNDIKSDNKNKELRIKNKELRIKKGDEEESAPDDEMPFGLTEAEITQSMDDDRTIETTAADYGLQTESGYMVRARDMAREYSLNWLVEAIKRGAANCKGGLSWNYVDAILRNWKKNGGIDSGKKPESKVTKVLPAQAYAQRNYTDDEINRAANRAWREALDEAE